MNTEKTRNYRKSCAFNHSIQRGLASTYAFYATNNFRVTIAYTNSLCCAPDTHPVKGRHADELRVAQQEQRDKASWYLRIHRGLTEVEWHEKIATKTARSIVDTALHRCVYGKGGVLEHK